MLVFQIDETRYIAAIRVGAWIFNKGIDTYDTENHLILSFNTMICPEQEDIPFISIRYNKKWRLGWMVWTNRKERIL